MKAPRHPLLRQGSSRFSRDEERALHDQMRAGDQSAREQLILSQIPWALVVARRIYPRDEWVQAQSDAMLAIIRAVDGFDPDKCRLTTAVKYRVRSEASYFNAYRSRHKRRATIAEYDLDHLAAPPPVHPDMIHDAQWFRQLALKFLHPKDRDCFWRHHVDGETLEAIGEDLDLTRERVRQLSTRARTKLRALAGNGR